MSTRTAVAGRCPQCGRRTLRGTDQDGSVVVVETGDHTAADELRAWVAGRTTYRLAWRGHMELDRRTPHDLIVDPAGYSPGRIYAAHICTREDP